MKQVAQDFSEYLVIMLVARAGWHTSEKLNIPENIQLIPQPDGSPQLNPTEQI